MVIYIKIYFFLNPHENSFSGMTDKNSFLYIYHFHIYIKHFLIDCFDENIFIYDKAKEKMIRKHFLRELEPILEIDVPAAVPFFMYTYHKQFP